MNPNLKFFSLQALNKPKIDFFSLDVEGAEMPILANFPWGIIDVEAFLIEVVHIGEKTVSKFMRSKGYKVKKRFRKVDVLYVKKRYAWYV